MQVGQKIWASLDFITSKDETYLTQGKEYEVKDIDLLNNSFSILSDTNEDIYFFMDKFDKYFSLTPPKEVKEGECMKPLKFQTEESVVWVHDFDEEKDLWFDVFNLEGKMTCCYFLTPAAAAQLRDHLTEALNKLKNP